MGNLDYVPFPEAQKGYKIIAEELRKIAEEWDGIETGFSLRVATRRLGPKFMLSDIKQGLQWAINQGYVEDKIFPGDEESSLLVGDMQVHEGWY